METDADPSALSDTRLLELARPRGARAALRSLGCPVVLGGAAWFSWGAASWIGAHTWTWLGWVTFPFLFLSVGVLLSAVLAVIAGRGSAPLWTEARRRVGQMSLVDDMQSVRDDLGDRAEDQRGWVVLLRGVRNKDRLTVRLRLDLRTDVAPPAGEVVGVRGPRLDTVVNPPRDLTCWERISKPVAGSVVRDLATLLESADLGTLPANRGSRETGWSGLLIQVAPSANEWTFSTRTLDEGSLPTELVAAAMATLGWDPTGSPVV